MSEDKQDELSLDRALHIMERAQDKVIENLIKVTAIGGKGFSFSMKALVYFQGHSYTLGFKGKYVLNGEEYDFDGEVVDAQSPDVSVKRAILNSISENIQGQILEFMDKAQYDLSRELAKSGQ